MIATTNRRETDYAPPTLDGVDAMLELGGEKCGFAGAQIERDLLACRANAQPSSYGLSQHEHERHRRIGRDVPGVDVPSVVVADPVARESQRSKHWFGADCGADGVDARDRGNALLQIERHGKQLFVLFGISDRRVRSQLAVAPPVESFDTRRELGGVVSSQKPRSQYHGQRG